MKTRKIKNEWIGEKSKENEREKKRKNKLGIIWNMGKKVIRDGKVQRDKKNI